MNNEELEIEKDAIRYANTQPKDQWNAAKVGYMAGAQDVVSGVEFINNDEVSVIYELVWDAIGTKDIKKNELINSIRSKLEMGDTLIIKKIKEDVASDPEDEYEPPMCYWCNGTGESRWGTGSCRDCGGSGVEKPKKQKHNYE